jgi:hypothetical protein
VVGASGGVKNVVVFLYVAPGGAAPAVHPSFAASAGGEVRLDNVGCRFEPRITLLRTTQKLVVGNKDATGHNTKIDGFNNRSMNENLPAGSEIKVDFPGEERLPLTVACTSHPWMTSRLVVRDSPYMAVSDEKGAFKIEKLPVGEWTFQFWHEQVGYVRQLTQDGVSREWPKGRVTLTIKPGANDLGTIRLAPRLFFPEG